MADTSISEERLISRTTIVSTWAIPIMVLTGFSFLATVPVLIVLISTIRNASLRWWGVGLAAVFSVPWLIWLFRSDPARSLSRDMSPVLAALIIAIAVAMLVKIYTLRRRHNRATT